MASATMTTVDSGKENKDSKKGKNTVIPSALHGPDYGNLELSPSFLCTTKVVMTFAWNLSNIHVVPRQDVDAADNMNGVIDSYAMDNLLVPLTSVPPMGYLMLAAYTDEHLYRAQVICVNGDMVDVFFVDFGDTALNVPYSNCFEIPEEVRQNPIRGIVFHVLGVPKEAETMIGPKTRCSLYCDGTIQVVEKKTPFSWVGYFFDENNIEWSEKLCRILYSLGARFPISMCFNPWSMACLETLKRNRNERLKDILVEKYGHDFLFRFADECFPIYKEKVKKYQKALILKKYEDMNEEPKYWSDLDFEFYYSENDVPELKIPGGTDVDIRISYFTSASDWGAALISEPYKTYRKELSLKLKDFCERYDGRIKGFPVPGRLYFVKVLTWAEIDDMMRTEKEFLNQKWEPRFHRRSADDDNDANKWFRGIAVGPCGSSPSQTTSYEFYLIDTGRFVPVRMKHIVPAVFRFVMVPCLGTRGAFAFKYVGVKKAYHDALYEAVPKGTKLACTIITGPTKNRTLVTLPEPVEEKIFRKVQGYKDFDSLSKDQKYQFPHNLEERTYNTVFL